MKDKKYIWLAMEGNKYEGAYRTYVFSSEKSAIKACEKMINKPIQWKFIASEDSERIVKVLFYEQKNSDDFVSVEQHVVLD